MSSEGQPLHSTSMAGGAAGTATTWYDAPALKQNLRVLVVCRLDDPPRESRSFGEETVWDNRYLRVRVTEVVVFDSRNGAVLARAVATSGARPGPR